MKTEAADIDRGRLARLLDTEFELGPTSLTFFPKGEDAYGYVAEGRDGARHFVRAQESSRAGALEPAYRLISDLRARCALPQIVAPRAARSGAFTVRHGPYTVAVFPFVEGTTLYDGGVSDRDLIRVAALLADLHRCGDELPSSLSRPRRETFENPFKTPILRALRSAAEQPGPGKGVRGQARRLLAAEQGDALATLDRMDGLGVRARAIGTDFVLTHGDPNLDNLLKDTQGILHLTDWGDVALGPRERDLSAFTGERFALFLKHYVRAGKRPSLHRDLFAFYAYRWSLQEIADYATRLLFLDLGLAEDAHAWAELRDYLPIRHEEIEHGLRKLQVVLDRVLGSRG